jgi:hypothetical protein
VDSELEKQGADENFELSFIDFDGYSNTIYVETTDDFYAFSISGENLIDLTFLDPTMSIISITVWNQLADISARINVLTGEINQSINKIDEALSKLNLGIAVWCLLEPEDEHHTSIGYGKINNRWGLLIRSETSEWYFNDAPRKLRLECVDRIPELLHHLCRESVDLAGLIDAKIRRIKSRVDV